MPLVTPSQIRAAAHSALDSIDPALGSLPPDHPLAAIAGDLRQIASATDQTLRATNIALTRFLPDQLIAFRVARRTAGRSGLGPSGHRPRLAVA
jgi:hypothetical protein